MPPFVTPPFAAAQALRSFVVGETQMLFEARNPPQIPKYQKTPCLHEVFRQVRANFCLLPCDASQEPIAQLRWAKSPIASDFGSRTQIATLFAILLYPSV